MRTTRVARVTTRLSGALKRKIVALAKLENCSVSDWINVRLERAVRVRRGPRGPYSGSKTWRKLQDERNALRYRIGSRATFTED